MFHCVGRLTPETVLFLADASVKQKPGPPIRDTTAAAASGESLKRKKASKTKPHTNRPAAAGKADILKIVPYTGKKNDAESMSIQTCGSPRGFQLALFSFSEAIGREGEGENSWVKHLLSSSSANLKLIEGKPSSQAPCRGCQRNACDSYAKKAAAMGRSVLDSGTENLSPPVETVTTDAEDEQVLLLESSKGSGTCHKEAQHAHDGSEAGAKERDFAAFLRTLSTDSSSGGSSSGKGSRRTSSNNSDDEMMEAGEPRQILSDGQNSDGKERKAAPSRQHENRALDGSSEKGMDEAVQVVETGTTVTVKHSSRRRRQRRGPAGTSGNRKCFICRQDMHDGQIVGALWNSRTGLMACSSRNTHEVCMIVLSLRRCFPWTLDSACVHLCTGESVAILSSTGWFVLFCARFLPSSLRRGSTSSISSASQTGWYFARLSSNTPHLPARILSCHTPHSPAMH